MKKIYQFRKITETRVRHELLIKLKVGGGAGETDRRGKNRESEEMFLARAIIF